MKRKLRQRQRQWAGLLPTSGEILGGLARLIDWKPKRSAQERTWSKFCNGKHTSDQTRSDIVEEMIADLFRRWVAARPIQGEEISVAEGVKGLHQLAMAHVLWWDGLCARLHGALPMEPTVFTTETALRLVVVELAMRFGSAFVLNGVPLKVPPGATEPARDIGDILLPHVLREVLKESGITRTALAEALDVSKEAVDQWLKSGALIRTELLDDIAEEVSEKLGKNPAAMSIGLRMLRQLTRVLMPLVEEVGNEALGRLVIALFRLTAVCRDVLEMYVAHLDEEERRTTLTLLMLAGGECPWAPLLREAMQAHAPDESWHGAIATPPDKWASFLTPVFTVQRAVSRIQGFLDAHGFASTEQDPRKLQRMLLLPPGSRPAPWSELASLSPDEVRWVSTAVALQRFQRLSSQPLEAESVRELGLISEYCAIMEDFMEGELKSAVADLRWRCLAMYILGCMQEGQELLAQGRHPDAETWAQRMEKAIRSFPPFPSEPGPDLRPTLGFLRLMAHMQAELDAGRAFKPGPQDFAFLEEAKRPPNVEVPVSPPA